MWMSSWPSILVEKTLFSLIIKFLSNNFCLVHYNNFYFFDEIFYFYLSFKEIYSYLFKQFYDTCLKNLVRELRYLIYLSIGIFLCLRVNLSFSNSSCNLTGSWLDDYFLLLFSEIMNTVLGNSLCYLNPFQWIIALFGFSL